jgi:NTE family protein
MTRNDTPKVAFVLSGGAGLGAIQVGMLHALYERGIAPDVIVGTSAGAMNGAFIPLHVVAVDVISGEELRLSHGPVIDAVLASAAIPGVVTPVRWQDRTLMDGGVANNTPISHAVELGAQRIYVLPTGHACALHQPPRGALALALHAISLLTQRRLIDDIERHQSDARLIVLPPPCPLSIQPIDFAHADELISRALHDAREFLDGGGEERPPMHMRMHRHVSRRPRVNRAATGPAAAREPPLLRGDR